MAPTQPKPIAIWSTSRDVWEYPDRVSLFSELSDVCSEIFPTSGSMRSGVVSGHRMSVLPTDDSECSSPLGLLPTPRTSDTNGVGAHGDGGLDLRTTVDRMLPTPTTRDVKGPNQRGDDTCLHGALLPTPRAQNGEERNAKPWIRPLTEPQNLENSIGRVLTGDHTGLRSDGGKLSPDPRHRQPSLSDATEDADSTDV